MAAPSSRPVHPCFLNLSEGSHGAEFSTWAHLTTSRSETPNLVTAHNSTLTVYRVSEKESSYGKDALVVGFAGEAKLTVLTIRNGGLRAESLLDLTSAVEERAYGCASIIEQDMQVVVLETRPGIAVVACIIGGGVAVAVIEIEWHKPSKSWFAREPYFLPLQRLSKTLPHMLTASPLNPQQITTGFGDIISATFLSGYLEPVVVLLHSMPGGRNYTGRIGREKGKGGAEPLLVSAVSISVSHGRSALLWSLPVSSDSDRVSGFGKTDCLVIGPNTLTFIEAGQISQVMAVNGWARSTCPAELQPKIQSNPLIKLAIQLDGSCITWLSSSLALVSLRKGQLYVLQRMVGVWTLLPAGQTLAAVGEIAHLQSLPLAMAAELMKEKNLKSKNLEFGLLFAGSRLGDSLLSVYAIEEKEFSDEVPTLEKVVKQEDGTAGKGIKNEDTNDVGDSNPPDAIEKMLQREEEALYAPDGDSPDVVPPSDDEEAEARSSSKRQKITSYSVLRALSALDSITNFGPLGKACQGPVASTPQFIIRKEEKLNQFSQGTSIMSDPAHIFPCGYGSSGGIAHYTVPGRDDRNILGEEDCVNVDAVFSLSSKGIILFSMSAKVEENCKVMQIGEMKGEIEVNESSLEDFCGKLKGDDSIYGSAKEIFDSRLHSAIDLSDDSFGVVVEIPGFDIPRYCFAVLRTMKKGLKVLSQTMLREDGEDSLVYISPPQRCTSASLKNHTLFGVLWSSGDASIAVVSPTSSVAIHSVPNIDWIKREMDIDGEEELDREELEARHFYGQASIQSIDVFESPDFFDVVASEKSEVSEEQAAFQFEDLDEELYGSKPKQSSSFTKAREASDEVPELSIACFCVVTRQSSAIEIYRIEADGLKLVWKALGCGLGAELLRNYRDEDNYSPDYPRFLKVCAKEVRFFECCRDDEEQKRLYVALALDTGDFHLYSVNSRETPLRLERVPLSAVHRHADEAKRHKMKLIRRKILSKDPLGGSDSFRYVSLHRFDGLSGQRGLFACLARPHWILSERGRAAILYHRTRHAAPAGATDCPVSGFCTGILDRAGIRAGYLTIHARVGQVGSQRMTIFDGLGSGIDQSTAVISAGSLIERKLLGVTIRAIEFVDDDDFSTASNPLYALLVSKNIEKDQRNLNMDELTEEERLELEEKKEAAMIKRQVEADLGGYEMDSEFVEEIDRDDCFAIDRALGGAPPGLRETYSLWIVDGSNDFRVIESFDLGENEYGLCLNTMELSEFKDVASSSAETDFEPDLYNRFFITVGTAVVDKDGEDVGSKGRALLFELHRPEENSGSLVELSLTYEKEIFHGPITTMACVSNEGRNRLILGSGSDVNVEQWGNEKLTQVGFFRATMQILDIKIFKNFLILSDAYDSLYFLIWRDTDKSLTLLAKDYDPIAVYASGVMSRGPNMTLVCHDDRQNLQFFQYAPGEAAARGGNRLVCRADCHIGTQTTSFVSHFCRPSLLAHSATPKSTIAALKQQDPLYGRSDDDQRIGVFFGTTDGTLGSIVPISEPVYWRLTALQSVLANAIEIDCSLNPKAWRLYRRATRRSGCRQSERKKGVVDGDIILKFADLPVHKQEELASAIGSTVNMILDNLLELEVGSVLR